MDMTAELTKRTEQIENIIKKYLPEEEGYQKQVIEAMNYSFLAGGKRLRPMLMLETYRMFGGKSEVIEPFMAAIEMIHTYSLVHDDLRTDSFQTGNKVNHIPVCLTAEAMEAPVNLHAGVFIVMEGADAHPVSPYPDTVMLGGLPGGNRLLHGFKYVQ